MNISITKKNKSKNQNKTKEIISKKNYNTLNTPTNDTRDILYATRTLSKKIYKKGYNFIKAGVILSDFYDKGIYQSDFFIPECKRPKSEKLMKTIDKINDTSEVKVTFAAQGIKKPWSMQRYFQSPKYTTIWNDLLVVR